MALKQRQMACFEKNTQFLNEVAAVLLPLAAGIKASSLVALNTDESSAVEKTFAAIRGQIADQILSEQGINLAQQGPFGMAGQTATGGSTAMRYLVQQMLLMETWTMTPDEWAADEAVARATIQASMTALLSALTAIPTQPVQQEKRV